jgi:hypothetical protein
MTMRHILAIVGVLAVSAGTTPFASAQTVSFAGTWRLNAAESDKPAEKLKEATSAAPKVKEGYGSTKDRVGAGRVAGDPDAGGGMKSGGEGRSGGGGGTSLPGLDFGRIMRPAAILTIAQNDTVLTIEDDRGLPQILYLDGRKFEEPTAGAELKQTIAKWKDGKLTVERKLGGSGSIREVYTLDPEKHRLIVDAKLTSPELGKTLEIRRVYDGLN